MSLGQVGINLGISGTHGSSHIHVPHPFPSLWQSPLLKTSLHLNILIASQEADFGHCIFIKFLCFTYLFQKNWTLFFPELLATSQDNLVTKALFKSSVFLILIPPAHLGRDIESQRNRPFKMPLHSASHIEDSISKKYRIQIRKINQEVQYFCNSFSNPGSPYCYALNTEFRTIESESYSKSQLGILNGPMTVSWAKRGLRQVVVLTGPSSIYFRVRLLASLFWTLK